MTLKEAASLLGWSREKTRVAIEDGIVIVPGRHVTLVAQRLGSDYDVSDIDLEIFISSCEAAEPGRHPPIRVRRELLIEVGYKCAICRSDAPLQFHHIIEWAEVKHHDPRHMLAICGVCHDKITRTGSIDTAAQRMMKARVLASIASVSADTTHGTARVPVGELQQPERTILDQSDQDRVVWTLPRGIILIEDVEPQKHDGWAVTAHYYHFDEGWRGGTHFHISYERYWVTSKYEDIQMRKLNVPVGDWVYGRSALNLIRALRAAENNYAYMKTVEEWQDSKYPLSFHPAGKAICLDELDLSPYAGITPGNYRDLVAEVDVWSRTEGYELPEMHGIVRSLRHRGYTLATEVLV